MSLVTILSISTGALFLALVGLVWYTWNLLARLMNVSENLNFLVQIVFGFRKHLEQVYKLPMFYGDKTLEFLIQHTKQMSEDLKRFEDVYSLAQLPDFEEEEYDTEEYYQEEEVNTEAPPSFKGKTIFHQGS